MLAVDDRYRRYLPHIAAWGRPLFITFATYQRWVLPPGARTLALRHAIHAHRRDCFIHLAVVMLDHVHLIMTLAHPLDTGAKSLASVMKGIKGVSARRINHLLGRVGHVWQDESFDHDIRRAEGLERVCDYVIQNPVRAGLVAAPDDYPWLWRVWLEGRGEAQTGVSAPRLG